MHTITHTLIQTKLAEKLYYAEKEDVSMLYSVYLRRFFSVGHAINQFRANESQNFFLHNSRDC